MKYIYDITLSMVPSGAIPVVNVKQGDTSTRFIRAKIVAGDEPYILGAEQTILFREDKPDGTGVLTDSGSVDTELGRSLVTVDAEGAVVIELTTQMLSCAGYCKCDLCFIRGGDTLSTSPFVLDVTSVPGGSGRAVSTDDFRTLINALDRVWESGVVSVPGVTSSGVISIGTGWVGDDPYSIEVSTSYALTEKTVVNVMSDADLIKQMMADGVTAIYFTNNAGRLTAYAIGGRPSVPLEVPVLYLETEAASYDNVRDGQVIAYDGSTGDWKNKDLSEYGYQTEAQVRSIVASYGYQTAEQVTRLIQDYIQALDGNSTEY